MKTISAFDVIGPNMIGPSSSHTAGALHIAFLARRLIKGRLTAVRFTLFGSFAQTYRGHGTDRALVAGVLGFESDDVRIRDSFDYAERAGVKIAFEINGADAEAHPNTVDIHLESDIGEKVRVRGVSTGGGSAELRAVDNVEIKLSGEYETIFIRHDDKPGVVAYITDCMAKSEINIAFMSLYRTARNQQAYSVIETDHKIPPQVADAIEAHTSIASAMVM